MRRQMDWLRMERRIRELIRSVERADDAMDIARCLDAIVADETGRGSSLPDIDDAEARRLCHLYPEACLPWYGAKCPKCSGRGVTRSHVSCGECDGRGVLR